MSVQRGIAGPIRRLLCSLTRSCSQRCERPQLNPEAGTAVMRTGESAKEHRLFHHASGPGRLEGSDPGRGGVRLFTFFLSPYALRFPEWKSSGQSAAGVLSCAPLQRT